MKLIVPINSDDAEYIDTEIITHDDDRHILLFNADGFAGVHGIQIEDVLLTWEQLAYLEKALVYARDRWAKESG